MHRIMIVKQQRLKKVTIKSFYQAVLNELTTFLTIQLKSPSNALISNYSKLLSVLVVFLLVMMAVTSTWVR